DVDRLMNLADAYVLSSYIEGLPLVLLEAQASGLIVVATDVGGVREVVQDGVSGFVIPAGDVESLRVAMEKVMAMSWRERREFGVRGRQWVESNFSFDEIASRWEE